MNPSKLILDHTIHRQLAADLFNATWDLMDKSDRTTIEEEQMIHMAHASRHHWDLVGEPLHFARGEWQVSRAYALVKRHEPALHHAMSSLHWCLEHDLGSFDLGFAHEAMARAYALQENDTQRDMHITLATQAAQGVEKEADRDWLMKNVDSVKSLSIPEWE